ncbi:MAG TPA: hypothetical protein VGA70_11810, partial [Longimicrobiales bacterium]
MSRREAQSPEARISVLASRQHGVVLRGQLLDAGLTSHMVDSRVRRRHLRPVQRGVYLLGALVGPLEPAWAREMAAVLACGPGAVVSHESAASLWELLRPASQRRAVHVTIPGVDRGRRPGIHPHRVAVIPPEDATVVDGVPVTTPVRTIIDLACRVRLRTLEQVVGQAERGGLVKLEDLAAALERGPRTRGSPLLRRLISQGRGPVFTRSMAEERFLALTRKGGLPAPETNVSVSGSEVDFLWRSERVAVEVDGFAFHGARPSFESDRRRDARLS